MARLHSDLGQRTVYLEDGTAKAQEKPCVVYRDAAGTQLANLADYDPATPGTPGAAIPGAAVEVDAYSNRPAFWDLDDLPRLWISVDEGPVVPILPDAQPQIDAAVAGATAQATAAQAAAIAASLPKASGKNLFDYTAALGPDRFWGNNGSSAPITLTGWYASPLIPVTPDQSYAINNPRNWQFMNAAGVPIAGTYVDNTFQEPITVTAPAGAAYLVYNVSTANLAASQVEAGTVHTAYEPYGYVVQRQLVNGVSLTEVGDTVTAVKRLSGLVVWRSGSEFLLRSVFDDTRDVLIPARIGGAESQFQFINSALLYVSLVSADTSDARVWPTVQATATNIHDANDDNCPINVGWSYVAANHGYASATQVTANGHGKTTADLGSTWTESGRTYTLLQVVDANRLVFGHPYTVSSGRVVSDGTMPVATLTHVAGATNTASVPVTGGKVITQLHPSSYGQSSTVELDGKPIPDGKSAGQVLTVTESYLVASYKGMVDAAQANIGTPLADLIGAVPPLCRVSNTYRITQGGAMTVAQRVTVLEVCNLSMGVTQAYPMTTPAGGSVKQFMGGVGSVSGVDLSVPVAISTIGVQLDISAAARLSPLWPASTMTQWAYDSTGNPVCGLAMGYLPVADSHPVRRLVNAASKEWMIVPSTKKNYPQIAWSRVSAVGDSLSGTAFRRYLAPPDTATEIAVSDGSDTWVVIERPTATSGSRANAAELLGRRLVPVGPATVTVSDRVSGEGVSYSVPVAPGYGMWQASAESPRRAGMPGATRPAQTYWLAQQGNVSVQPWTGQFQRVNAWAIDLEEAVPVDRVCVEVTTVGTGVVRHGVYLHDPATGQPVTSAPLCDFGTVDVTATGIKETTLAGVVLPAGVHWYAVAWQGTGTTAPTLRVTALSLGTGPMNLGSSSSGMSGSVLGYFAVGVAGAFGNLTLAGQHQLYPPRLAYRRA